MTVQEYLNLITSAYRDQPKFSATIDTNVSLPARVQELLASMVPIFDLDTAMGDQLDIIGKWVGITRDVSIPITDIFFSWDADATLGWEYGTWQPFNAPTNITELPDDAYRTLIKAKIAANYWTGTTDSAYAIWDSIFTTVSILIIDHQDMSYAMALVGGVIDSLTMALLVGGYIPLKPEGVRIDAYYVSVDDGPVFGWDVESDLLGGWDEASWVRELVPT